jgi:hypothetical protein
VVILNNAPTPLSNVIDYFGLFQGNTITLSQWLIVSSTNVSANPRLVSHELGHTWQARFLGPAYLGVYAASWVVQALPTAVIAGSSDVHKYHWMEATANIIAGLPWDWNGTQ